MSGLTRARNVCLTVAVAAVALGVFVSTSAGSSSTRTSTHRAAAFRVLHTRSSSGGYVYRISNVISLGGGDSAQGTLPCPKSAPHPISGQFASNSNGGVVLSDSFADNAHTGWTTRLTNLGKPAAKTQIGVVCHS
jgi:hypothetical protein